MQQGTKEGSSDESTAREYGPGTCDTLVFMLVFMSVFMSVFMFNINTLFYAKKDI